MAQASALAWSKASLSQGMECSLYVQKMGQRSRHTCHSNNLLTTIKNHPNTSILMPTELTKGIYAVDMCTYLSDIKALIISDIHIGFEEALGKQGVFVPRFQYNDIIKRLDWIFNTVPIKTVVLNGD